MMALETDYLIVGAGAAGMAFADTMLAMSNKDIVMIDRRYEPGGHWVDSYPFVSLHQPSAFYGVNSVPLGSDRIDTTGPNAGFYERATGLEIRTYYQQVLDEHLLRSGRVRFMGGVDYTGDWSTRHTFRTHLTGAETTVRVRKRLVDTTYLNCAVPSTHTRRFSSHEDAHVIAVGQLPSVTEARFFTILGGGKTAMDACCWLMDNGVDPERIRWICPRDSWLLARRCFQPYELGVDFLDGMSRSVEALAEATDTEDFLLRVEASGMLVRLHPGVWPTMFRGAIASPAELESLRQIERVVRRGHVLHIDTSRIVLQGGEIPTSVDEVHVDCTAYGLGTAPLRPTYEPGRITIQASAQTTPRASAIACVEAIREDDADKNRICPPSATLSRPADWIRTVEESLSAQVAQADERDFQAWRDQSRLHTLRGLTDEAGGSRLKIARARWSTHHDAALANAARLLSSSATDQMQT